jgi:hypothetical protein
LLRGYFGCGRRGHRWPNHVNYCVRSSLQLPSWVSVSSWLPGWLLPFDPKRRFQVYPNGSDYRQRVTRRSSPARDELLVWAKARDFRDRATEYLNRARLEPDGDVQRRFVDVAQHYRILAEAEASNAGRLGNERRGQSETSQSGSRNGSIEVQALRLKLQLFASQQTDQTIRRQCHAVDKKLAEVIEGNHPTLRQVLANFS